MRMRSDLYKTEPRNIEELIMCYPFVEFSIKRINNAIKLSVKRRELELKKCMFDFDEDLFTVLYRMAKEICAQ